MLPDRGNIPADVILCGVFIFLLMSVITLGRKGRGTGFSEAVAKYACRMFFLLASYLCLRNVDVLLHFSLRYLRWDVYHDLVTVLVGNLNGGNYYNFFIYFVDVYVAFCVFLTFPYLYWLERRIPVSRDRYVNLLRTLMSLPGVLRKRTMHWNAESRLGLMTILVKVFFVPLMVSWSINNFVHLKNSTLAFHWNIYFVNAYLVALFIFVDTVIFATGYLVELPQLDNEIKSVEPSLLGWLVCLWCYPPFNIFSFRPFDYCIIRTGMECPVWAHVVLTCIITLLWGIFVWSSIALGFKASNLTNRGIVREGPYRYVRHPAYTAKLLIWIIQGIFFSQFGVLILLGFVIVYALRAWTEERHLSLDPDYLSYCRAVKWRFLPGII
ncbi:MAG: isoprenylcysteine carboxylmethyltransferase family protein [Deltaproteobacteria bacterium]|nr:isoprenylcysteine carboxylmethyltransferase family protein [Deltaproteobacteria bacterium]